MSLVSDNLREYFRPKISKGNQNRAN